VHRILLVDNVYLNRKALSELKRVAEVYRFEGSTEYELAAEAVDADVLIVEISKITRRVIDSARHLKGIIVFGVGYDNIDVQAASRRGIYVINMRGANAEAVAEFIFFLILDRAREGSKADRLVRGRGWTMAESGTQPSWLLGTELFGKTLGLVGVGEIGRRVARIAHGFSMKVLVTSSHLTEEEAVEIGVEVVPLNRLLKVSDVIAITTRLDEGTKDLIGAKELACMKRRATLINTSRGAIVNEVALTEFLEGRRIKGAGLDVFSTEPMASDNKLLDLENVTLSPHIAGNTKEANDACADEIARSAKALLAGKIPRNVVNLNAIRTSH
jgi:phosphoglycerate dehydrogenase-like enzyme